jgi:hypothetical protein
MALFGEGFAAKEIAKRLNRNAAAVRKVITANRDLKPFSTPPLPKKRSGRPRMTNNRGDKRLHWYMLHNLFKTAKEIKNELPGWKKASIRLIQQVWQKRLKILSCTDAKKPLLTAAMVKKRLAFCKKHLHWTEKDSEIVSFSDKATFKLINPRSQQVRRLTGINRYKQKYVTVNVKHLPQHDDLGLFLWRWGIRLSVLPSSKSDHERRPISGDAARQAPPLDDQVGRHQVPSSWLGRQFSGSQSYRKPVGYHEG